MFKYKLFGWYLSICDKRVYLQNLLKVYVYFEARRNEIKIHQSKGEPYVNYTRRVRKVKIHPVYADGEIFYAYCGNTAFYLDPLPVCRARLTVVEPALFE